MPNNSNSASIHKSSLGISNWPLILIAFSSLFAVGILDNIRGPFFPDLLSQLSLSDSQGALFYATTSFMMFVGTAISPSLEKKINDSFGLRLGFIVMALGFGSISQVSAFPWLLFFAAVFGLGFGISVFFQHKAIERSVLPEKRRQVFTALHSMYAASALLAPLITNLFLKLDLSWRESFLFSASIPFIMLLVSYVLLFKKPQASTTEDVIHYKLSKFEIIKASYVALFMGLYVSGELIISTRLVLYLKRNGFSISTASWYLAGFFTTLLIGRILFTFLSFSAKHDKKLLVACLVSVILCMLAALNISPIFFTFCGFLIAPFFPTAMDYVSKSFGEKSSVGISSAVGWGAIVVVIIHYVFGVYTDMTDINTAFYMGPAVFFISLVLMSFYDKLFSGHS